jgi:iron complex outermembrane receptor protein
VISSPTAASARALLCLLAFSTPAFADDVRDASEAAEMDSVIVSANPIPGEPPIVADARKRLSRTPGAVAAVSAESYDNRLATGFADILRDVPGVLAQKRYGEESRLSIRGSGIDQSYHQRGVLIAQDGVPFADADGFSDFQKVDALGARYVEVYKGGNALRFGGAQLGGAVNLVTPNGKTAEAENELRLEGGSFGSFRGRAAFARQLGNWDIYAAGSGLTADGWRDHSAQSQGRGTLNVGYSFGEDREIRAIGSYADIKQEVPGTLTLADALTVPRNAGAGIIANDWARDQTVARGSLQTRWRFNEELVFEGGFYATATKIHHPIVIVIDQDIETQGAFGRFDWAGDIAGMKADLFWGVSYRQGTNKQQLYVNMGGSSGFQFGDSRQKATGLDVFAEGRLFVIEPLAIVVGGSYGRATRDYTDYLNPGNAASKNFDWFSPRVGLLWAFAGGAQVYANVTRSVEPPHYGALVQAPNPGFVPVDAQRAWTGEVGARGRTGDLAWDVTFYRAWVKGELLSFRLVTGVPASFFNADKTIHQGIEAALDWTILRDAPGGGSLSLKQSYTFSDFTFDGDPIYGDNRLPVAPRHQYRAELTYRHPAGWYIAPAVDWRPEAVWADYANTMKVPGYALLSIGAGIDIGEHVTLYLDGRNLTGKRYVGEFGAMTNAADPAVAKDVFFPGEGRSVFAGLTVRL